MGALWRICDPFIVAALLFISACTILPTPTPTPSPSPTLTVTPSTTPVALAPLPTSTPKPTVTPTPTPIPSPSPVTSPIRTPVPDVGRAQETLLVNAPPRPFDHTVVNSEPPRRVPGAIQTFWVTNTSTGKRRELTARLRVQTDHAAMWVEENIWHDVRRLEEAAHVFETQIYSTTRAAFGSEWTPGVDNDPHIHVLHATDLGEDVLGYFSSANEFPRSAYAFSNQAEMITVNIDNVKPGSPAHQALLASQFQRLIQWNQDRNEERWVKEGLAELAASMNGRDMEEAVRAYLEHPDTSLTAWAAEEAQRGAAYLLTAYFHERFGNAGTRMLSAEPGNGVAGFDATLDKLNTSFTHEDLFADWLAANYLDSEADMEHSHYSYAGLNLDQPSSSATYSAYPLTLQTSVQQFGADYIVLRGDADLRAQFVGGTVTPLLNVLPHSGRYFWWSNQADESLCTLMRAFDLSDVEQATLTYWTWYALEENYDYVTVEASTDAGGHWEILHTPAGTGLDPHGNNPGWGYTGHSDGWIREEVDLSAYAGEDVLVRFAYLTDEAVTEPGFLLDDIAVPEIDCADDVEEETGEWKAAGFVHSGNFVPQRYLALLISLGDEVAVERLPIDEDQTAEWIIPLSRADVEECVLVLSGLAPFTTQPALYQLEIEK